MHDATRPIRAVMFSVNATYVKLFDQMLTSRGHKFVGLVTAPGPRTRRSDEYRAVMEIARPGLDVIVSNYPNRWADMIRPMKPDMILCVGSNWKIPSDVLEVPPLGVMNAHDGFLPKYRGRNATGWALRTGEPGYGISFHRMTWEFDQGPVLAQHEIVIADDEDGDDVLLRMEQVTPEVMEEAFDRLIQGFPGTEQVESEVTYAGGAFEPEWREVDWNKPAKDIFFQIRSWSGFRGVPRGAFGEVDGNRLLITRAKPVNGASFPESRATPGSVVARNDGELFVQCADHPIRILQWEEAPDNERHQSLPSSGYLVDQPLPRRLPDVTIGPAGDP